jgi:L-aspartate oxidase
MGANFDMKNGKFALGREGGHTENRIVHHKDITGFEIERALLKPLTRVKILKFLIIIT